MMDICRKEHIYCELYIGGRGNKWRHDNDGNRRNNVNYLMSIW